jgi:hypothetical protein
MREILDDGKRHQCQKLKTRRNLLLFLKAASADPVADQVIEQMPSKQPVRCARGAAMHGSA